ncbi:lipoprotein signal peptidase [Rhodoflexus caldus]|uniref:lipoprotein signal peptidase n=1 Tax=Rhodoflexus caldus TaxID=2891236 RepID=UPI00202A4284|nr:lipoprotein signal peptidase [Rhodoflexus caldus]
MKYLKYYLLALAVILVDQAVKLAVHEYMQMGPLGEIKIFGDWFKLHYTLNPGMAFGLEFGSEYGKIGLTLFRIVAVAIIAVYIAYMARRGAHSGFIWCMALVLGGALGNVIDSTFYGVLLDNALFVLNPPPLYPWFHGQVIDMFYLDIWEGALPDYIPLIGGNYYSLWPIFNVADASIFIGVMLILIFQGKFFDRSVPESDKQVEPEIMPDAETTKTIN